MATFIIIQGGEMEIAENYNLVRHRLNKAQRQLLDYQNGNIDGDSDDQKFDPYHQLSFKTAEGGRISVNVEKVIGVSSDEAKDAGSSE